VNTVAPILGLNLGPFEGLRLGLTWRSELDLVFDLPVNVDLGDALVLGLLASGNALYTPHSFNFGAAWKIFESGWLVTTDLNYQLWSNAPDPTLEFVADVEGELVEGFGLEDAIDMLPGPSGLPGFSDTLDVRLGVEWLANEHVTSRIGYHFRPTPIPNQVGLTNFIDTDSHTISAGIGLTYDDPLNLDSEPVTAEFTGALSLFPTRTSEKLSENDPIGDFSAGGQVFTMSFSLRHDF
jgi:long-subunit fatty acid transport protein